MPHGKAQLVMKRAVDGAPVRTHPLVHALSNNDFFLCQPVEEEEDGEEEAVGEESSTQEDGAPKKKKRKQKKPDEVDLFTGVSIQVSCGPKIFHLLCNLGYRCPSQDKILRQRSFSSYLEVRSPWLPWR